MLRTVAAGATVLDPEVVGGLINRLDRADALAELTRTEGKVLALMARGLSNIAIATDLVITERAVNKYVNRWSACRRSQGSTGSDTSLALGPARWA